jgi:hypothetical protein
MNDCPQPDAIGQLVKNLYYTDLEISKKLSAQGYEYFDRVVVFGCKDR